MLESQSGGAQLIRGSPCCWVYAEPPSDTMATLYLFPLSKNKDAWRKRPTNPLVLWSIECVNLSNWLLKHPLQWIPFGEHSHGTIISSYSVPILRGLVKYFFPRFPWHWFFNLVLYNPPGQPAKPLDTDHESMYICTSGHLYIRKVGKYLLILGNISPHRPIFFLLC